MEEEEVRRCAETGKNKAQQVRTEGPWSKWKPMLCQALGFLFMALPICITNWCDAILKLIDTYRAIFGH
ncbi:hypothetical protein [Aeromonas veronii]|uniref:hypothetical protein n=1 Tax=Aeromonas veronii TaxID=654 RepID=UPI001920149D|nr:hypothetical protein [Aeromonas veronii]MBL0487718.1 hypothetical protein [Aeromonas veronii]UZE59056.1 hypothetical protein ONR73_19725 [Aeromonas veronii]